MSIITTEYNDIGPLLCNRHVRWLKVPVHNSPGMQMMHSTSDRANDGKHTGWIPLRRGRMMQHGIQSSSASASIFERDMIGSIHDERFMSVDGWQGECITKSSF